MAATVNCGYQTLNYEEGLKFTLRDTGVIS